MIKHFELSKELENVTLTAFLLENPGLCKRKVNKKTKTSNILAKTGLNVALGFKKNTDEGTQLFVFQKAIKVLLICGQLTGLQPIIGMLNQDVTKIRFRFLSWRYLHSSIISFVQAISAFFYLYHILASRISIRAVAYFSFYITTTCTTVIFQRIAYKWPTLLKEIYYSGLDEYVCKKIVFKINFVCITLMLLAVLEHILALISRFTHITDCSPKGIDIYEELITKTYLWVNDLGIPYSLPLGVILQFTTITSTINWNYSDVYIICLSLYLNSILDSINKKIESMVGNNNLPLSFWRYLREDYNKATRLVRSFDDVINGVIFTSFFSNLFFICLHIYSTFEKGFAWSSQKTKEQCPNYPSGPFSGYEDQIYLTLSLFLLFGRSIAVLLVAAKINTASVVPVTTLYGVPPSMYCNEVQRFIDQVHSDKVGLSGFKCFYVTRELLLSVAGIVVTYELVLLQFGRQ